MTPIRACSAFALLVLSGVAGSAQITYFGNLSASAELPPTSSTATGFTLIVVDSIAQTMRLQGSFSGLSSGASAAMIHCCTAPPGNTVVATETPSFPGFPLAQTAGTYDSTLDLTLASSYNSAFVSANGTVAVAESVLLSGIAAGTAYFNIHTASFPGGEIRSFLIPDEIFANGVDST